MRKIARQLKRIAFGWCLTVAAEITRTILKRFTSADEWEIGKVLAKYAENKR
jgi:hypothetical protein